MTLQKIPAGANLESFALCRWVIEEVDVYAIFVIDHGGICQFSEGLTGLYEPN